MNKFLFTLVAILLIATFAPADEGDVTVKTGTLQIGGYIQTGYYSTSEETTPPVGDSTTINTDTFKARRVRAKLSSTIIDKIVGGAFEYDFVSAINSTVGGTSTAPTYSAALTGIQEAYFWMSPQFEPLQLIIGRTKLPWMQEYLNSSSELLWVDRSIVADKFSFEFDYGLKLDLKAPVADGHKVLAALMYSNGYSTSSGLQPTDFDSVAKEVTSKEDPDNPGTFIYDKKTSEEKDLKDLAFRLGWDGKLSEDFSIMLGAGVMMNKATKFDAGSTTAPDPKVTTLEHQPITADLTLKAIKNLTVLGAYTMDTKKETIDQYALDDTTGDVSFATTENKYDLSGMYGGIAYNFPVEGAPILTGVEPAVRYAMYDEQKDVTAAGVTNTASKTNITQIAGGLNLYCLKHNAKLQINYVMQNQKDTPYSGGVAGDETKKDTSKIQAQFQVKF
jgi:hypothetical protein